MNLRKLVNNSHQKISIWSDEQRKRIIIDSLFLEIYNHSEANKEYADFLTAEKRPHEQIYRLDEEYNFILFSNMVDKLEYREGIWILPIIGEKDIIFPNYKRYSKYKQIAKANKLI